VGALAAALGAARRFLGMRETGGRIAPPQTRFRWRLVVRNGPFVVGALILLFLVVAAIFGPRFASQNPYLSAQRSAELLDGELIYPPFAPSAEFRLGSDMWGRDILSLLLYGARNTLVACAFVTMVRLLLGIALGAVAGWHPDGLVDRAIMGLVETLSSLPMLLTGMILIFAFDIRRGLVAFLLALSLVGWGEIAQYVRSELISLRSRPFVEGARVIGLTEGGIVVRHILPNVLPQLVVLTLLEMGAVLMLLGELAFVGVLIGGGIQVETFDRQMTVADIPEWGALLAGARRYIRSAPWMVFYPAAAFFVAVLGANLLGEGLRRIIREAGVNTAAVVSKRMVLIVLVICGLTWYVVNRISPGISYAELATQFEAERALAQAEQIVDLQRDDPGFGATGASVAAEYIAAQFEAVGLLPAAGQQTYLQPVVRYVAPHRSTPLLALRVDGADWTALAHGSEFGEQVYRHGGSGQADAMVAYVGFDQRSYSYADFAGLDLRDRVVVVRGEQMPLAFDSEALIRGARALLILTEDVEPQIGWADDGGYCLEQPTLPILHVRPEAVERILSEAGLSLDRLDAEASEASGLRGWWVRDLALSARVEVDLGEPERRTGYNVLGILPGNDLGLDEQVLVLSTHYDMPEPDPGAPFISASDGPAGVAIMLEMARLWQESAFRPRRAVLFCAWAGGYLDASGALTYLDAYTPYLSLDREAVLHLGSVGAGDPVLLIGGENSALRSLAERSSAALEVEARLQSHNAHAYWMALDAPSITQNWTDAPEPYARGPQAEQIDRERLGALGEIVNLVMITASRQYHY